MVNNLTTSKYIYPPLNDLTPELKNVILHFTLLWSLFEHKLCAENANVSSIEHKCEQIKAKLDSSKEKFDEFLYYFRARYITESITNSSFDSLEFRTNDKKDLVEQVLKLEETNILNIVIALLIIVFRYRNNLFHGLKWQNNIEGQEDNFDNANRLLIKILEINK